MGTKAAATCQVKQRYLGSHRQFCGLGGLPSAAIYPLIERTKEKPQGCVRSKCRSATSAILAQHSGGNDGIGGGNQEMALTLGADL